MSRLELMAAECADLDATGYYKHWSAPITVDLHDEGEQVSHHSVAKWGSPEPPPPL